MTDKHEPSEPLVLPDVLDLKAAGPLVTEFLSHRGHNLTIDASNVSRLGGQCLQVLLSAKATWEGDDASFELVNPSEAFIGALEGFGCPAEELMDQEFAL